MESDVRYGVSDCVQITVCMCGWMGGSRRCETYEKLNSLSSLSLSHTHCPVWIRKGTVRTTCSEGDLQNTVSPYPESSVIIIILFTVSVAFMCWCAGPSTSTTLSCLYLHFSQTLIVSCHTNVFGTDGLFVLMCREAVSQFNQLTNQSINGRTQPSFRRCLWIMSICQSMFVAWTFWKKKHIHNIFIFDYIKDTAIYKKIQVIKYRIHNMYI